MSMRELQVECEEQARLNGMGGERELKLQAELERAKAEGDALSVRCNTFNEQVNALTQELERANQELEQLAKQNFQEMMKTGLYEAESENERLKFLAESYRAKLSEVDSLLEGLSSGREMGTDCNTASEKGKRYAHQIQIEIRAALGEQGEKE